MPRAVSKLAAQGVAHRFGEVQALGRVSLKLEPVQFTCLVGPSGCGKSTLLRILAGLLIPSEGEVLFNGQPLRSPSRALSLVFQDANLMPWRTVEQNLRLPLELAGVPRQDQAKSAAAMLDLLGLSEFRQARPGALSGGMAQRLAIGRALIADPEVLLLDEPFGALDALTRETVSEELLRIWASSRKTVLMVTHSIQEAVLLADRVLVMSTRPGVIVRDLPIPLPRPRSLEQITQPDFVRLAAEVRAALRPQLKRR
ncbi:MAG: ABC transporter ATP-binding protein [Anaerolineae bacterium]|nr:ABC transporter ATP-binding protein [Anaerolineae bacterium]